MPDPLGAQRVSRSQYLADALQSMQGQGAETRTPGALGANLLASYLLQRGSEREQRLDLEAQAARSAEIDTIIQDPRERLFYESNPEAWAEYMRNFMSPRTLAAGSSERAGADTVFTAPQASVVDDRVAFYNAGEPGGVDYSAPRGPTFQEETGRIEATAPVNVGPGARLIDPVTRELVAAGGPVNVAAGATLVDPVTGETVATGAPQNVVVGQGGTLFQAQPGGGAQIVGQGATPGRQLTATEQRQLFDDQEIVQGMTGVNERLSGFLRQIDTGELQFGAFEGGADAVRNFFGQSDPESRNSASFQAALENLRNESLRLNSGVQTEGDAQRAWNELLANLNDTDLVRQRLTEIMQLNERAVAFRSARVADLENRQRGPGAPQQAGAPQGGFSRDALLEEARRRGLVQ
jgi:hypothetical protein